MKLVGCVAVAALSVALCGNGASVPEMKYLGGRKVDGALGPDEPFLASYKYSRRRLDAVVKDVTFSNLRLEYSAVHGGDEVRVFEIRAE